MPEYLFQHLEEERLTDEDFEVQFFRFMDRVCRLRHQQKLKGFVDASMVHEAQATLHAIHQWNPKFPSWVLPDGHRSQHKGTNVVPGMLADGADKVHRFIWVAMSWLFIQIAQLLIHETLIVYFRAQHALLPTDTAVEAALNDAIAAQTDVSLDLQDAVDYYLVNFQTTTATSRSIGAHMLMMPLSILLGTSTTTAQTYYWIAKTAGRIADKFALKQGKMVADFLMMGVKAKAFAEGAKEEEPLSFTSTVFSSVGTLERTETEGEGEGDLGPEGGREPVRSGSGSVDGSALPTPSPSPRSAATTPKTTTKSLQILIS